MDGNVFIDREIGNYRITQELNSGGYGSVYKAEHMHLKGRFVAIKLLHAYLSSPQEREQFAQEAQFLALLEHPHILPLLDFGFVERQPYLVAQYAADGSLRDLLKRQSPLPVDRAIAILAQVGQALHHAHQQQIIHRDLKPENILFHANGSALLADFGIATMLSTASVKHLTTISGTPPYMAPEQFQGVISREGDQYALGCIAYELLTGQPPFDAPDFLSMGFKHLTAQPQRPSHYNPAIPALLEEAILTALAKQRNERHADVSALLAALQAPVTRGIVQMAATPPATPPIPSNQTVFSDQTDQQTSATTILAPLTQESVHTKEEWVRTGDEAFDAEDYTEALVAYKEALRLDPDYADAYHNKGNALSLLQRYEEALLAYKEAIRLDPHLATAHYNKGNALHALAYDEEALLAYEEALRLNPRYTDAYLNKGIVLHALVRHREALEAFDAAIRLNPDDATAYHNKGNVLYRLKRYKEALAAFEKAVRRNPNDGDTHAACGNALYCLKYYKEALAAFDRAIQLDPNNADIYISKRNTLHALGRHAEAWQVYEKARQLSGNR